MSDHQPETVPPKSDRCAAKASLQSTIHLSFTPAQLRALADKAEKLIEECPSIHVEESYFLLERHQIAQPGSIVSIRLFATWVSGFHPE
ncbi:MULTISPECIES: hypothetical protein [Trichocoleus]|uniref:Uncharacterized protein n=1 Tax=Trichocoleus desertorum GB2-A4 TaxID=2933944 RepID=A0ABV0JCW1_9CYAN|nr:hypothetical protein [Trichocoleus sp. FACHB-46]MBD1864269.1 hypothetical protein [Trichocoleus sp. FACHB-46]